MYTFRTCFMTSQPADVPAAKAKLGTHGIFSKKSLPKSRSATQYVVVPVEEGFEVSLSSTAETSNSDKCGVLHWGSTPHPSFCRNRERSERLREKCDSGVEGRKRTQRKFVV